MRNKFFNYFFLFFLSIVFFTLNCSNKSYNEKSKKQKTPLEPTYQVKQKKLKTKPSKIIKKNNFTEPQKNKKLLDLSSVNPNKLINIENLTNEVTVAIPYATEENFTHKKLYAENKCFLRGRVALNILKVVEDLKLSGYKLKFFDCYRPHSVSVEFYNYGLRHNKNCRSNYKKCRGENCNEKLKNCLWEPLAVYLSKGISFHNRGCAVDVTITKENQEVDMGTEYVYFGPEAHTYYFGGEILKNRKILIDAMRQANMFNYANEWWHFNSADCKAYKSEDVAIGMVK